MPKQYRVLFLLLVCLVLNISVASARFKGARESIAVEDEGVKEAARLVMERINKSNLSERELMLVEIKEAEYQVVQGLKYFLHLIVADTDCSKNQSTKKCKLDESRPYRYCGAEILQQEWLRRIKIKFQCNSE